MKIVLENIERFVSQDKVSLNLSRFEICDEEIQYICQFLDANVNITTLLLGYNRIGVEGAKALATNTTLTTLKIWGNRLGAEGAKVLAANTTLKSLNISNNRIGDEGAKALASNTIITALNVKGNGIGTAGAIALATNNTLHKLVVSYNNIGVKGAKALVTNTVLIELDISDNNMGASEKDIVEEFKYNTAIIKLFHSFRDMHAKESIKQILDRNLAWPWLITLRYTRLFAQAQRSQDCPLGTLPVEVLGIINNYAVDANQFRFFINQFGKRPTAQDMKVIKQMAQQRI